MPVLKCSQIFLMHFSHLKVTVEESTNYSPGTNPTHTVFTKEAARKTAAPIPQTGCSQWLCSSHRGRDECRYARDYVARKDEKKFLDLSEISSSKTCYSLASLLSTFFMEYFFTVGRRLVCFKILNCTLGLCTICQQHLLAPSFDNENATYPMVCNLFNRETHCTVLN